MSTPSLSFEFFPPRTDAQSQRFWRTLGCLETVSPSWVSVTYGALGSAAQASLDTIKALQKDNAIPVAAHLTCSGQTVESVQQTLDYFVDLGINHIVALRGDKPARSDAARGDFTYAEELVNLISQTGRFDISVAAYPEVHPEARSLEHDLIALKAKFDAGAMRALTQFFFEPDVFLRWRDSAVSMGIDQPIVPGILPIHNIDKVIDFSARCGATVPPDLIARFQTATTADSQHALAIEQCVELCSTLKAEGVDDFHIYTLNQSTLAYSVSKALLGGEAHSVAA